MAGASSKDIQDLTKSINSLIKSISTGKTANRETTEKKKAESKKAAEDASYIKDFTAALEARDKAEAEALDKAQRREQLEIESNKRLEEQLAIKSNLANREKEILKAQKISLTNQKSFGTELFKELDVKTQISEIDDEILSTAQDITAARKAGDKEAESALTVQLAQLKNQKQQFESLKNTGKAENEINKAASKRLESYKKITDVIKSPLESLKKLGQTLEDSAGKRFNASLAAPQKSIMEIATSGIQLGLIGGLIAAANTALHVNDELVEMQRNFGMSKHEAEEVHHELLNIAETTSVVGATSLPALNAAYKDLASVTSQTGVLSREMLETHITLTKQLGMSGEEASKFQTSAAAMNMSGDDFLDTIDQVASKYEQITGDSVNQTELARDLAKISKKTFATYKGDATMLAKAALQAKKMGMSLEDTAAISEKLLDVESSLEAEMKANVLTGKSMNLDKARQLALDGDIAQAAAEAVHQAGDYDEFMKLRPIQQKAIADAAGMTVEQLTQAGQLQKMSVALGGKQIKAASELTDADMAKLEASGKLTKEEKEKLRRDRQAATFADNQAKVMEKLKAIFNSLAGKLEPVLEIVGDMIGKLADGISWFIKGIGTAKEKFKSIVPDWVKKLLAGDSGGMVKTAGTLAVAGAAVFGAVKLFKKKKPEEEQVEILKSIDTTLKVGGGKPGGGGAGAAGPSDEADTGGGKDIKTSIGKKLLGSKLGKKLMGSKIGKMLGGIGKSPIGAMIGDATGVDVQGMLGGSDAGAAGGSGGGGSDTGKLLTDSSKKGAGKLTETAAKAGGAGTDVTAKASKGGGFFGKIGGWLSEKASKLNPLKALKGAFSGPGLKKILGKIPKIGGIVSTAMALGGAATAAGGPQEVGKQLVMAIGDMGGTFLGGLLGSIIPGAGTLIGGFLGGMAGSSLAGLIADNVDLSSIGKTAIAMFGGGDGATAESVAPEGAAPVAVKDALIRPGMPPVTFDKGDLIMAGTNLGGQGGAPAANNSNSEIASLLKQLIAKVDQPVQLNIGGKAIDEISKQTSVRKSYSAKVDGAYGAMA